MNATRKPPKAAVIHSLDKQIESLEDELKQLKKIRKQHAMELIDSWAPEAKLQEKYQFGTVYLRRELLFSIRGGRREDLGRALKILAMDSMVKVHYDIDFDKLKRWLKSVIKDADHGLDLSDVPEEIRGLINVYEDYQVCFRKK